MGQKWIDYILAILGTLVAIGLSWPFWRDFSYFAESRIAWLIYFVGGGLLSVWVFLIFIHSLRTLFLHDRIAREAANAATNAPTPSDASTQGSCCNHKEDTP